MEHAAKLLMASLLEKDGEIVGFKGASFVGCPACNSTIYLDQTPSQRDARDTDGKFVHCWSLTGKCIGCQKRFEYVLMPDNVPGYLIWTPLPD